MHLQEREATVNHQIGKIAFELRFIYANLSANTPITDVIELEPANQERRSEPFKFKIAEDRVISSQYIRGTNGLQNLKPTQAFISDKRILYLPDSDRNDPIKYHIKKISVKDEAGRQESIFFWNYKHQIQKPAHVLDINRLKLARKRARLEHEYGSRLFTLECSFIDTNQEQLILKGEFDGWQITSRMKSLHRGHYGHTEISFPIAQMDYVAEDDWVCMIHKLEHKSIINCTFKLEKVTTDRYRTVVPDYEGDVLIKQLSRTHDTLDEAMERLVTYRK